MVQNVVWKEGLFIRPQHFQQSNFYFMSELMKRTRTMGSNQWGLFGIEIDVNALALGKVLIKNLSGVMPDGIFFELNESEYSLGIDIKKSDIGKNIYLAITLAVQNRDEIFFEHQDERTTRYRAKSVSNVPNLNSGEESSADIIFAEPNFQLLREEALKENHISMKLMEIKELSMSDKVSLDKSYIPTFLHLDKAFNLVSELEEILTILENRSEKIAHKIRGESLTEVVELGEYLMLQFINKTYTRLHHYSMQSQLHPSALFLELNSAVAELQVLMSKNKKIVQPLIYVHKEQNESFKELFLKFKELLGIVLEEKSVLLNMEKAKLGFYRTLLTDKSLLASSSFILVVTSKGRETDYLKRLLLNNFRISTVEEIQKLVRLNLSGYKLLPLSSAPRQITHYEGCNYFKIHLTEENKEELFKSSGFAFYLSEKEQIGLSFTLWAIKEK